MASVVDVERMPEGFTLQWSHAAADVVADTMAAVSLNPDRRFTIYHYAEDPPLGHEMQLADLGLYYSTVPYEAFKRACLARGEGSPLHGFWSLIDHGASYWFSGNATEPSLRVCNRALRADCPDPIQWPSAYTILQRSLDWLRAHRERWAYRIPESRLDYDGLAHRAESFAREYDVPAGAEFIWASSDSTVAVVNAIGLVQGIGDGVATITAAAGSARGAAVITVSDPTVASFSTMAAATAEGDIAVLEVVLDPPPESLITLRYTLGVDADVETDDADSRDYAGGASGSVAVGAGETATAIAVAISDDATSSRHGKSPGRRPGSRSSARSGLVLLR